MTLKRAFHCVLVCFVGTLFTIHTPVALAKNKGKKSKKVKSCIHTVAPFDDLDPAIKIGLEQHIQLTELEAYADQGLLDAEKLTLLIRPKESEGYRTSYESIANFLKYYSPEKLEGLLSKTSFSTLQSTYLELGRLIRDVEPQDIEKLVELSDKFVDVRRTNPAISNNGLIIEINGLHHKNPNISDKLDQIDEQIRLGKQPITRFIGKPKRDELEEAVYLVLKFSSKTFEHYYDAIDAVEKAAASYDWYKRYDLAAVVMGVDPDTALQRYFDAESFLLRTNTFDRSFIDRKGVITPAEREPFQNAFFITTTLFSESPKTSEN